MTNLLRTFFTSSPITGGNILSFANTSEANGYIYLLMTCDNFSNTCCGYYRCVKGDQISSFFLKGNSCFLHDIHLLSAEGFTAMPIAPSSSSITAFAYSCARSMAMAETVRQDLKTINLPDWNHWKTSRCLCFKNNIFFTSLR